MGLQSNRQNSMETSFDNFIELPKKDDNEKNAFLGKKKSQDLLSEEQ